MEARSMSLLRRPSPSSRRVLRRHGQRGDAAGGTPLRQAWDRAAWHAVDVQGALGKLLVLFGCGICGACGAPVQHETAAACPDEGAGALPALAPLDCGGPADRSLCQWASGLDAVVVGKVRALRGAPEPVSFSDGLGTAEECLASTNLSLHLQLTVERVIFGAAPAEVTIALGPDLLRRWSPRVLFDGDGCVSWPGGLAVGQPLGAGLFTRDGSLWGLSHLLFSVDDAGALAAQQTNDDLCISPTLQGTLDGLATDLAACDVVHTDVSDRLFDGGGYLYSVCTGDRGAEPTTIGSNCTASRDCGANQQCIESTCHSVDRPG
jgi:hypothetical protein